MGKPATAIHAGVTVCETCHKSTASWAGAKVDHGTFTAATNCASCHNGSAATGKPATHIPVGSTNCASCHGTSTWRPTTWNHTQTVVTAQCSTCHSGAFRPADGRPANHIPYATVAATASANCDTCHRGSYATWANGRLHANATVSTQCASCHSGAFLGATGKPATPTHAGVTTCESCHRATTSWLTVTYAHAAANAVGTGTCDSCHRSQASFATAVTMSHTAVAGMACKTCHNGTYTSQGTQGALTKPANHIPEAQLLGGAAMDCKACHTSTSVWSTLRMNHNASLGGGAGWCKACHQSGTSFLGSMEKKSLTHEKKTPPAIDCSESGCHRPLGTKGAAYTKWD